MYKFVTLITLLLAANSMSAPNSLRSLPALQHEHLHDEFGQYALRFVTAEGTIVTENGKLVPKGDGTGHVMQVEGEVTYVGDDGKTYVTKYSAGVDGVKMEGDHLPVAPTEAPVDAVPIGVNTVAVTSAATTEAPIETTAAVIAAISSVAPADVKPVIPEAPAIPPMATSSA